MARPYTAEKQIRWWLYDNGFDERAFGPYVRMKNDDVSEVATIDYWDAVNLGRAKPEFAEYSGWDQREVDDDSVTQITTNASEFTMGIDTHDYYELIVDRDVELRLAVNYFAPKWIVIKFFNNDGVQHTVTEGIQLDLDADLVLPATSTATLILILRSGTYQEVSRLQL